MTPAQYQRAKQIFHDLCDAESGDRAADAARLAGSDQVVLNAAMALLASDERDGSMPEGGVRVALEGILERGPAEPEVIGAFRIVRRIGSGGMGDVYEAHQDSPRRRVAIKLMRSGPHSAAMLRRFRREIDFLGRLSHPGIGQVFETGVVRLGAVDVPYYVMELVEGLPLTQYAAANGLGVEEKLRLFTQICDAVQHAHQQGVIHRDLKPANILVQERASAGDGDESASRHGPHASRIGCAEATGRAMTRILDFGIARAVDADVAVRSAGNATIATEAGQVIGTVPYMSPEQISGDQNAIDTRTDVYALGVILFELLTGDLPHETDGLPLLQAAKVKMETPPARLSAVSAKLRGDLETIVSKALETDKERRYASASELGADVRRYLNLEVITARPATFMYQMRQFGRRNRGVVIATSAAMLVLVVGIVGVALQARAAIRERNIALQKTVVAEDVSTVLLNALTVATPNGGRGVEPTLLDTVERIESQARDTKNSMSPEVKAVVLNITGIIWRERGEYAKAEANFKESLAIRREVLAPGDPNLADSLNNMGLLHSRQGQWKEAAVYLQEAIDLQTASRFPDEKRLARNIFNLASAYASAGDVAKSRPLLERSLEMHLKLLGDENEIIGKHLMVKAKLAIAEGAIGEALDWNLRALEMFRRTEGPAHPSIAAAMHERSILLSKAGDTLGAIEQSVAADAMAHTLYRVDPPHPKLKAIREQLVTVLRDGGRTEDAARMAEDIGVTMGGAP